MVKVLIINTFALAGRISLLYIHHHRAAALGYVLLPLGAWLHFSTAQLPFLRFSYSVLIKKVIIGKLCGYIRLKSVTFVARYCMNLFVFKRKT